MDSQRSIYYKATTMEAKSFYRDPDENRVLYVVGETIAIPESRRVNNPQLCSSDVLHASTTPSETLTAGLWPCRLFEVSGTLVAADVSQKCGFVELHVEREIEAWRALGPNGREIVALLAWLDTDGGRVRALQILAAVHRTPGSAATNAAWKAGCEAARSAERSAAWSAAGRAAGSAAWGAVWSAAFALCVRDLITPEHFALLYNSPKISDVLPADSLGPWDSLRDGRANVKQ